MMSVTYFLKFWEREGIPVFSGALNMKPIYIFILVAKNRSLSSNQDEVAIKVTNILNIDRKVTQFSLTE